MLLGDLALTSWVHFLIPDCGREQARHHRQWFQGCESLHPWGNIKDKVLDT